MHKYADDTEIVKDYLQEISLDNAEEMAIIARRNEAVSAFIDSYTGRRKGYFLEAGATATTKRITGSNKNFLILPVHVAGTVSVAGISSATYYESDKNGWLYVITDAAASIDDYVSDYSHYWGNRQYLVTARWGFEETPAEIIEATKQIVARWFEQGKGILGDVTPTGFVSERDLPPSAKTLLQSFIKGEYEVD